jgi:hypothetical protein
MTHIFDTSRQRKLLKKYHTNTKQKVSDKIIVTGRSKTLYFKHLFPDYNPNKIVSRLSKINVLDIGSGLNHLYNKSLLYELTKKGRGEGGRS